MKRLILITVNNGAQSQDSWEERPYRAFLGPGTSDDSAELLFARFATANASMHPLQEVRKNDLDRFASGLLTLGFEEVVIDEVALACYEALSQPSAAVPVKNRKTDVAEAPRGIREYGESGNVSIVRATGKDSVQGAVAGRWLIETGIMGATTWVDLLDVLAHVAEQHPELLPENPRP